MLIEDHWSINRRIERTNHQNHLTDQRPPPNAHAYWPCHANVPYWHQATTDSSTSIYAHRPTTITNITRQEKPANIPRPLMLQPARCGRWQDGQQGEGQDITIFQQKPACACNKINISYSTDRYTNHSSNLARLAHKHESYLHIQGISIIIISHLQFDRR